MRSCPINDSRSEALQRHVGHALPCISRSNIPFYSLLYEASSSPICLNMGFSKSRNKLTAVAGKNEVIRDKEGRSGVAQGKEPFEPFLGFLI